MLKKGIFTISIDTELAWGTFDHGGHIRYEEAYKKYRLIIGRLVELFKKYEISATWAVVGHLFLKSCKKENSKLHPDIIRPKHNWFSGDWFRYDPGTDISKDNFWYGTDIVEMIKNATPKQEIACHSFCHPIFSDPGCSRETAESDVAKCVTLAKEKGIDLNSFVFPRNSPGHLDVLSEHGFKVFRGKDTAFCNLKPEILRKGMVLFSDMLAITPPVVVAKLILDKKLVEVKSSMLFRFAHGASKFIPKGTRFKKAKKGIDAAIRKRKIFHIWLHPISFAWETSEMFDEFEKILAYAYSQKRSGNLKISTLQEIGDACFNVALDNDKFNPKAVTLHDYKSYIFKKDYSDDLASYYSNAFKYGRKKIESALLAFLDNLGNGNRILDVGTGTGYYLNLMQKRGNDCIGVDLSENMLQQLRSNYADLKVQLADARRLPFIDNSFDALISVETLRYFQDRESLLKEIFRVVRPGGYIFITAAPLFSGNAYGIYNTLCRFLKLSSCVSCYQSFETANSLKVRLKNLGFIDIDIKGCFFGPFCFFDKINLRVNNFLLRRFESLDMRLSKYNLFNNFSNHLVCIARKPN